MHQCICKTIIYAAQYIYTKHWNKSLPSYYPPSTWDAHSLFSIFRQLSSSWVVWPWPGSPLRSACTPSVVGSVWPQGRCWGHCSGPRHGNTSWWGCSSSALWVQHNATNDPPVCHRPLTYDLCRIYCWIDYIILPISLNDFIQYMDIIMLRLNIHYSCKLKRSQ